MTLGRSKTAKANQIFHHCYSDGDVVVTVNGRQSFIAAGELAHLKSYCQFSAAFAAKFGDTPSLRFGRVFRYYETSVGPLLRCDDFMDGDLSQTIYRFGDDALDKFNEFFAQYKGDSRWQHVDLRHALSPFSA